MKTIVVRDSIELLEAYKQITVDKKADMQNVTIDLSEFDGDELDLRLVSKLQNASCKKATIKFKGLQELKQAVAV